jgi:hypothetical protein
MSDKYIDHFVIKTGDIYKKLFINNYFVFKYNQMSNKMANIQKIFKIENNEKDIDIAKHNNVFDYVDELVSNHEKTKI